MSNKRIIAGSTCKDSTGALGGDTFHVGGGSSHSHHHKGGGAAM